MYMQARNSCGLGPCGLGEIDWGGILKDVVGGYAAVKTADAQADIMKMQIQAQQTRDAELARQLSVSYQMNPQYSGTYGAAPQSSNMMPILLIGGAALAIFLLMRK